MKKDKLFSLQTLILVFIGILINFCGARLALFSHLPLFLDSVGTILAAVLGGVLPGIIVGFVSNYANSISDPITLYYGLLSVLIAIIANGISRRGLFMKLKGFIIALCGFSLIGGALGSLMTWMLYGLNMGNGISADFTVFLYDNTPLNKFSAQFTADIIIDIVDKLITILIVYLIIKLLPKKLLEIFPSSIYLYGKKADESEMTVLQVICNRRASLGNKITALFIIATAVLSIIGVYISYTVYNDTINDRYIEAGETAVTLMSEYIDANLIDDYLNGGETESYNKTEEELYKLKENLPILEYMYVYKILNDGCHVVFDLDTEGLEGGELGEVIKFDKTFTEYLPKLLNGEKIEPVISNDSYGWLLTVYYPLTDDSGKTAAYAAVDISMEIVMANRYIYVIRTLSLLFCISVIIVSFALWFVRDKTVAPLNLLTQVTDKLAYDNETERKNNIEKLKQLDIRTGDEIENLYHAISKTTTDVSNYLELINRQNSEAVKRASFISHLQDNIIISFANMVETRDETTGTHVKRTSAYVREIGLALKNSGLFKDIITDEYLSNLEKSAPLHDIGKIRIPDSILCKPGKLTTEEFEIIKTHTTAGKAIISEVLIGIEEDSYLSQAMNLAYSHHERWDGNGYPEGKKGEEIPLCARIMSVADVFDALISKRSYKEPYSFEKAIEIIKEGSGTQFDPTVVSTFLSIEDIIKKLSLE